MSTRFQQQSTKAPSHDPCQFWFCSWVNLRRNSKLSNFSGQSFLKCLRWKCMFWELRPKRILASSTHIWESGRLNNHRSQLQNLPAETIKGNTRLRIVGPASDNTWQRNTYAWVYVFTRCSWRRSDPISGCCAVHVIQSGTWRANKVDSKTEYSEENGFLYLSYFL